jgi:hypothetical protein
MVKRWRHNGHSRWIGAIAEENRVRAGAADSKSTTMEDAYA